MPADRALITGVAGQDGSYLAELLLARDYEVWGLVRQPVSETFPNLEPVRDRLHLVVGDARDPAALRTAIESAQPHEIYHLAGPSFIPALWDRPGEALSGVAGATASLLELALTYAPAARILIASSREIFGDVSETPQRETTPCRPTNPYGIAKLAGHLLCQAMRAQHGMYVCSAILYNHESPRRPEAFLTRKVTRAVAAIKLGLQHELALGDLSAVRDWCFAGDAMRATQLMLAQDVASDYVIASGQGRTVEEFVRTAFACAGLDADEHVRADAQFMRPPDRVAQVGDPTRAHAELDWRPDVTFESLVELMVESDIRLLSADVA